MTFEITDPVGVMAHFVSDALRERGIEVGPSELEPIMTELDRTLEEVREIDWIDYQIWLKKCEREEDTDLSKDPWPFE